MKVDKPGVLLEWEFKSEPKGIAFGMFYCRKESASQTEVRSVCVCVCVCVCVRACACACVCVVRVNMRYSM